MAVRFIFLHFGTERRREVCEVHFTTSRRRVSCPSSLMPTRLADGLEAKKSSPVDQMRPCFATPQNLWFPHVVSLQLWQLNLAKCIEKSLEKASFEEEGRGDREMGR